MGRIKDPKMLFSLKTFLNLKIQFLKGIPTTLRPVGGQGQLQVMPTGSAQLSASLQGGHVWGLHWELKDHFLNSPNLAQGHSRDLCRVFTFLLIRTATVRGTCAQKQ